jgi:hypothetical protein
MAGLVLVIIILLDSFSLPHPCKFAIHIFSEKLGLVKRITKLKNWKKLYLSTALLLEYDLLSVILEYMKRLPTELLVHHVKGHQADEALVCTLPLPAQLNYEADALAMAALEYIPAPIPSVPVFPSAVFQLDVREATTTRWSAVTPDMVEYLKDRNRWDQI